MAKLCPLTGKRPMVGNTVSHANNKRKRRFIPNLQYHRYWVPSLKQFIRLRLSTQAMRIIDRVGIETYLHDIKK